MSATITPRSAKKQNLDTGKLWYFVYSPKVGLCVFLEEAPIFSKAYHKIALGIFNFILLRLFGHLRDQMTFLDNLASTSALTYKVQRSNTTVLLMSLIITVTKTITQRTIVLMEIQG